MNPFRRVKDTNDRFANENLDELKNVYEKLETLVDEIPEDGSPVSQIQFGKLTYELMRTTRCLINEIGIRLDAEPW